MTDTPILYSFRRCPYAMRARLALQTSNQTCEIREVKLANKPDELIEASPKATVPVLVLPGGQVVEESFEVMQWALSRSDPGGWLERADQPLIDANDGPFKYHLDRYKYPERHASDPARHRAAGMDLLAVLNERLITQAFLSGEAMGLTDAAIMPFVRQFANTDRAWFDAQPLPALQSWLGQLLASPLFDAVMFRLKPWTPGDEPIFFPANTA